jgi:hypothetical protein
VPVRIGPSTFRNAIWLYPDSSSSSINPCTHAWFRSRGFRNISSRKSRTGMPSRRPFSIRYAPQIPSSVNAAPLRSRTSDTFAFRVLLPLLHSRLRLLSPATPWRPQLNPSPPIITFRFNEFQYQSNPYRNEGGVPHPARTACWRFSSEDSLRAGKFRSTSCTINVTCECVTLPRVLQELPLRRNDILIPNVMFVAHVTLFNPVGCQQESRALNTSTGDDSCSNSRAAKHTRS